MFQRIKGAIDQRIAEEQARAKAAAAGSVRTVHTRGSTSRNDSPSKGPRSRQRVTDDGVKGPDPSEFERSFVIEDDSEGPSRAGTPALLDKVSETTEDGKSVPSGSEGAEEKQGEIVPRPASIELPVDIRTKLRKLDKLESRYQELLRSYRIAHTRAVSIEPFEKMLKENTPLISISDPGAFVEYLSQLNTRGDMVMDELKRVTADRDDLKRKLEDAEKKTIAIREDLTAPRTGETRTSIDDNSPPKASPQESGPEATVPNPSSAVKSPVASVLGIFSPNQKSVPSESNESIFSYDDEIVLLQTELKVKNSEIVELKQNVKTLHENLSIAEATKETLSESLKSLELQLTEAKDPAKEEAWKATVLEGEQKLQVNSKALQDLEAALVEQERLMNDSISSKDNALKDVETLKDRLGEQLEEIQSLKRADETKIKVLELQLESLEKKTQITGGNKPQENILPSSPSTVVIKTGTPPLTSTTSKKKNKKKKKTTNTAKDVVGTKSDEAEESNRPLSTTPVDRDFVMELSKLEEEIVARDRQIELLKSKRKGEEDLKEEVENMRESLLSLGQEHVEAKDIIKELRSEKKGLEDKLIGLQSELEAQKRQSSATEKVEAELDKMTAQYQDLKAKTISLQSDLGAAQQLATSRYRDLTDLRDILEKAQPELKSLRVENSTLKSAKEELIARTAELRRLEGKERDLKADLASFKKTATDKEADVKSLNEKLMQEANSRLKAEDQCRMAGRDLRRAEADKIELSATNEKTTRELSKIQAEAVRLRGSVQELETKIIRLSTDNKGLRDEIELKNSQYISAQSLVGAMRDQTSEMATQLKEAKEQASSLEEELSEVQRLLSERTREGETMRRLLQDVDDRADTKVRDMRERMEAAIEDRDRTEEEASVNGRRRAREIEDLKNKIRDLERDVNRSNEIREELEGSQKEWRRRKEELETASERATREVSEIHNAMDELRGALDESEKQAREAEKQKTDLRRLLDEASQKYEKLQKSLKAKQQRLEELTSSASSRSSMERDSFPAKAFNGTVDSRADYVYLKTILLQFLEQKDKKLQAQLVPVLGKLLHFDKKDEQKWMAAIAVK